MVGQPSDHAYAYEDNMLITVPCEGAPVRSALLAVRDLVVRHEGLRTAVEFDRNVPNGAGWQRVAPPPRAVEDIEWLVTTARPSSAVDTLQQTLHTSFDPAAGWPFRAVVDLADARPDASVEAINLVLDHSATDAWGIQVLAQDLRRFLGTSSEPVGEEEVCQPLDLAAWEDSPEGQSQLESALGFWRDQLHLLGEALPDPVAAADEPVAEADHHALSRTHWLVSKDLHSAALRASARLRVPVSSVFLLAYGQSLCALDERPATGVLVLSVNRPTRSRRRSAAKMFLQAPVVVRRHPATTASDLFRQQVRAHAAAQADRRLVDALIAHELPGATSLDVLGAYFNFYALPGPYGGAPGTRETEGSSVRHGGAPLMLAVVQQTESIRVEFTFREGGKWSRMASPMLRRIVETVTALALP